MNLSLAFLVNALVAALVIGIIAYIADWFATKSGLGFPHQIIWLVALVVWLLVVFSGSIGLH